GREGTAIEAGVGLLVAPERTWRRTALADAALTGGLLAVTEQAVGAVGAVWPHGTAEGAAVAAASEVAVVTLLARIDGAVPARASAAAKFSGDRAAAGAGDALAVGRGDADAAGAGERVAARIDLPLERHPALLRKITPEHEEDERESAGRRIDGARAE